MLQETPKHIKLQIEEKELLALLEVRRKLVEGELDHKFTMAMVYDDLGCGTVGCIAGWMAIEMSLNPDRYASRHRSNALCPLFYPQTILINQWADISVAQAVQAIDHFLETGRPNW